MTTHELYFIPNGRTPYYFHAEGAEIVDISGLSENGITVLTTKLYNQAGELFIDVNQSVRIISVDWVIRGDLSTMRRLLASKLNPNLGLGTLVYKNDKAQYRIDAVVSLKPQHEPLKYNQVKLAFNVVFLCPKPDWLSYTPVTIKMEDFIGGLTYPKIYPFKYAERGNGAQIMYAGDNPAPVLLDLRGSAVNPIIENITTGKKIETQDLNLLSGQRLLIDTNPDAPNIQIDDGAGTVSKAWNKIKKGSEFWELVYGNNHLNFSAESGSPECYLTYYEHYSGV